MNTEQEIIYNILNTIRDSEHNNDERITEKLMRSFLQTYRAEIIRKYYKNGHVINEEVFQQVDINMFKTSFNEYVGELPKLIRLRHNYGVSLEKRGLPISLLSSEEYRLSNKNFHGKHIPKAKAIGNKITLYGGLFDKCCIKEGSENHLLIQSFYDDLLNPTEDTPSVKLEINAILHNPNDDSNYDWEKTPYPFPSERLDELKTQILRKEFQIMSKAKRDEISNQRSDEITYHDNYKVNQNG